MPELPDIANFKRYLDATSLHQKIERTSVADPRILAGVSGQKLARALKGAELSASTRYGKYLLVETTGDGWLMLHFGMTGELSYYKEDDAVPEYARMVIDFENGWHLAYISRRMLGEVGFVGNPRSFVKEHDLGPDALDESLDADWFVERVSGRRGMAKTLLMDQSFIAGIGNVYSDEILYQAGLHPKTDTSGLSEKQLRNLFRTMRRVLEVAVRKNGEVERLPRGYLLPHRDTDERCPKCGGEIRSVTISGRSAFVCPNCQGG